MYGWEKSILKAKIIEKRHTSYDYPFIFMDAKYQAAYIGAGWKTHNNLLLSLQPTFNDIVSRTLVTLDKFLCGGLYSNLAQQQC